MKILHVIPSYLPATQFGGPVISTHQLLVALQRRGHTPRVLTTNLGTSLPSSVVTRNLDGIDVTYAPTSSNRIAYSEAMTPLANMLCSWASVVHTHGLFLHPGPVAADAAIRKRRRCVTSPRGMLMKDAVLYAGTLRKLLWLGAFEFRRLQTSVLHFASAFEKTQSEGLGFWGQSSAVIPFGARAVGQSRRPREFTVGYLGRLSPEKNIEKLLAACEELQVPLIVAGDGSRHYRDSLERQGHGFASFWGKISGGVKERFFNAISVLVVPSRFESFGNVVIEAMAHACPVIVSERVGSADVVAEAGCGFVAPVSSLAPTLRKLRTLPESELHRLGAAGLEYVDSKLTWDRVARRFEALYSEV